MTLKKAKSIWTPETTRYQNQDFHSPSVPAHPPIFINPVRNLKKRKNFTSMININSVHMQAVEARLLLEAGSLVI
jgi:hypothetical protein